MSWDRSALWRDGFTVGDCRVKPLLNRVTTPEGERSVDPLLIELIAFLAQRPGQILTRDELLDGVWPGARCDENALSQAVSRLRKVLGDRRATPRYIETISETGYRLIATVTKLEPAATTLPARKIQASTPNLFWIVLALTIAIPVAIWLLLF